MYIYKGTLPTSVTSKLLEPVSHLIMKPIVSLFLIGVVFIMSVCLMKI